MTALKTSLVAALIACAGPALAGGGPSFVYFPTLEFPTQNTTATRDQAAALEQPSETCAQLLHSTKKPDACGAVSTSELAERKLVGDE